MGDATGGRELADLQCTVHQDVVALLELIQNLGKATVGNDGVPIGVLVFLLVCVAIAVAFGKAHVGDLGA